METIEENKERYKPVKVSTTTTNQRTPRVKWGGVRQKDERSNNKDCKSLKKS